jgi:hypothetical protein
MYFVEIFFCLFCNFHGSKPTRTRTQNREKQRNSRRVVNNFASSLHLEPLSMLSDTHTIVEKKSLNLIFRHQNSKSEFYNIFFLTPK